MQAEMNDDDDIILMDDDIPIIPRIFGGSSTGKAPNVDRRRVFTPITYTRTSGAMPLSTIPCTSGSFSRFPLVFLMQL
jgi:hypothetical protein